VSKASNTASAPRWGGLTPAEFHLIHHALRMLVKYLSGFDADKRLATELADEMWNLHTSTSNWSVESG